LVTPRRVELLAAPLTLDSTDRRQAAGKRVAARVGNRRRRWRLGRAWGGTRDAVAPRGAHWGARFARAAASVATIHGSVNCVVEDGEVSGLVQQTAAHGVLPLGVLESE